MSNNRITPEQYRELVAKGLIREDPAHPAPPAARGKGKPPELVAASFEPPGTWVVPCEVPGLANKRDWRVRNRVAQAHRRAVSKALGGAKLMHVGLVAWWWSRGQTVRCTLTRLGGKELDRTANLPASLKYVEDAVCLMLGIDDSDPLWVCECRQEPGGPCGVRITLEVVRPEAT